MKLDEIKQDPFLIESCDHENVRCVLEIKTINNTNHVTTKLFEGQGMDKAVEFTKSFFKNPGAVAVTALWAADALKRYNKNKRYTTNFFSKTPREKQFHEKIVQDLMKTGHYKMVKSTYVDGGYLWVLQRTDV